MKSDVPTSLEIQVLDGYPDQDSYQRHLSALLLEATEGQWRLPISDCPTGRAILRCQRELQVRILLAALVRRLWQLAHGCPESVARLFLLNELCRTIMKRKLPFEPDQLEAALTLVSEPTAATELGTSVLRQVEWYGPSTESIRDAVAKVRKVFRYLEAHSLNRRAKRLLSRPDPAMAPAEESPEKRRHWRALLAHSRRVPKKLSKRWRGKAKALVMQVGVQPFAQRLLPWVSERATQVRREETRLFEGLVCTCGELKDPKVADFLDRVATWGYRHVQGKGPRALRLANLAVDALGRMATTDSIRFLVALEGEFPYASTKDRADRALTLANGYLNGAYESIREMGIGDPQPESQIGRRLTRAHCKILERMLRSGHSLSGASWNRRYLSSRVLRQLVRTLVWKSRGQAVLGLEMFPHDAKVELWHPREAAFEEVLHWKNVLKKQQMKQPFAQIYRPMFEHLSTEQSPILRQYQFAAIARERGWRLHLVGRSQGSEVATLRLGENLAEFQILRADPRGRYHRNHIAYEVVLNPPKLTGKTLSPRHISEVAKDWNLFCRVARIEVRGP